MKQRLIRVLVYEGSPEWLADVLQRRGVKGSYNAGQGVIKEAIVGDFLEEVLKMPDPLNLEEFGGEMPY